MFLYLIDVRRNSIELQLSVVERPEKNALLGGLKKKAYCLKGQKLIRSQGATSGA